MNRAIATATITITLVRRWAPVALAMASIATACFYPPTQKPPAPSKDEVTLAQPYDLVWDAVHNVIRKNKLRVNADDLKGVSGKYAAEPDRAATVVYYFKVKPKGHEASIVSVQATFSAPLYIPLHRPRDEQCVSRGKAEARLLKQVAEEAAAIHRPPFVKPAS